jgi:hypothetical protein
MSSTDNKELNVKDVCEIIAACATNGVATMKWGSLEIQFKASHAPSQETLPNPIEASSQGPEKEPEVSPELLQKIEQDMKQEELASMMINDPAQFEELLSAGAIEHEQDSGTESTL